MHNTYTRSETAPDSSEEGEADAFLLLFLSLLILTSLAAASSSSCSSPATEQIRARILRAGLESEDECGGLFFASDQGAAEDGGEDGERSPAPRLSFLTLAGPASFSFLFLCFPC